MTNKPENSQSLLHDFKIPSENQWQELIVKQLKGASFSDTLVSETPEEIPIQPIYTKKDVNDLLARTEAPGFAPYLRGIKASGYFSQKCKTGVILNGPSASEINRLLQQLPQREDTLFYFNPAFESANPFSHRIVNGGIPVSEIEALTNLFQDLDTGGWKICLDAREKSFAYFGLLMAYLQSQPESAFQQSGTLINDAYSLILLQKGEHDIDGYWRKTAAMVKWMGKHAPHWSVLGVDGRVYHECGGHAVQELAFSLAASVEMIKELMSRGFSAGEVIQQIHFNVSIGTDFFMEIAKLRIIRSLWTKVVKAFDPDSEVTPLIVNAFTSKWNKTLYDPHVNVLRTTIEALSAIIGGVDGLCLNAFDYLTDESNAHSTRLAQNIPGIINEESFCDKVIDPAGGSWAIESLSDQLGQKAWSLFQEVEGRGGLSKAIREGFVQNHIETVAKQKLEAIKEGKSVLVGTNQFNNPAEQPQKLLEKTLEPAAPREKTQKQQDALSNVAEQIAACYITDQPNEALFGSTVDAFKTGVTIDDVKLELINGVVDSKMKIICVNQPLKIQRAAQPTEQSRENGQP